MSKCVVREKASPQKGEAELLFVQKIPVEEFACDSEPVGECGNVNSFHVNPS